MFFTDSQLHLMHPDNYSHIVFLGSFERVETILMDKLIYDAIHVSEKHQHFVKDWANNPFVFQKSRPSLCVYLVQADFNKKNSLKIAHLFSQRNMLNYAVWNKLVAPKTLLKGILSLKTSNFPVQLSEFAER